jgi:hypothetical protein
MLIMDFLMLSCPALLPDTLMNAAFDADVAHAVP